MRSRSDDEGDADMNVGRWADRKFEFTLPIERFPTVVERLRGAPARVEEKLLALPEAIRTRRDGDKWSIQEHAGHLIDCDELDTQRLDDFLARAATLRAWDGTNRKTFDANYNARPVAEIVRRFREDRERFVERLDRWKEEDLSVTAMHPRLQQPMRVIDMAQFVADHDDHHLAMMTELANKFAARVGA
jgi:uncharacterized damage-inducible protein DinB